MPMWRCPHCGVPQPEVARCWVCRRSSTSCATCRSFRTSVAAKLGYCALDRRRTPLDGDEIRPCWEPAKPTVAAVEPAVAGTGGPPAGVSSAPTMGTSVLNRREFVPIERGAPAAGSAPGVVPPAAATGAGPAGRGRALAVVGPGAGPPATEPRWSLFPELDP
jgi:hypothetical protein